MIRPKKLEEFCEDCNKNTIFKREVNEEYFPDCSSGGMIIVIYYKCKECGYVLNNKKKEC